MMENNQRRYQATLEYLYGFVDFSMQRTFKATPELFDLSRMFALSAALGHPDSKYPSIHIAGTKGKGSVAALCASALQAEGYRVGLYISPHLDDYAERIQIDGVLIPHNDLMNLVEEVKPVIESIPRLTTFEITTALAFLYFARKNVDIGVIEVGLGGRLDATNIINPQVSVITSLSYDHTYLLGDTLAQIAAEKAGIIKPGVAVVASPQAEEARWVLERIAYERGSRLVQIGRDYQYEPVSRSLDGQTFWIWPASDQPAMEASDARKNRRNKRIRLTIPLLGQHQIVNTATAYAALQEVRKTGLKISQQAILNGFSSVKWPGRFEILRRKPPVVIDCAHNRDSAQKLRLTLDEYFPGLRVIMVFGASEDKDVEGMFAELLPRVSQLIAVKSFHPRAMEPELLVHLAEKSGCPVKVILDVADALEEALRLAGDDGMVLVAGSIFVAAGARIAWQKLEH